MSSTTYNANQPKHPSALAVREALFRCITCGLIHARTGPNGHQPKKA